MKKIVAILFGIIFGSVVAAQVVESPRDIPIVADVDVVVVGGSSGAVSAALAAAERGASVFLCAAEPYLGADLCSTLRLWPEGGEKGSPVPLEQRLFPDRFVHQPLPFTYRTDIRSSPSHADTGTCLTDGAFRSATKESVQFNGPVTVTLDLGRTEEVSSICLLAYQRPGVFEVSGVKVETSENEKEWSPVGTVENPKPGAAGFESSPLDFRQDVNQAARYIRLSVGKADAASRILLGEVVVEGTSAAVAGDPVPRMPLQVKKTLAQALMDAQIPFLLESFVADVLCDETGSPSGVVLANRAGRQAIRAKVVIDATPRAMAARMSGCEAAPYPAGPQEFRRIVAGGKPEALPRDVKTRALPTPLSCKNSRFDAVEYTLRLPMKDASPASFANAEQLARDLTWHTGAADASEFLFQIPPDHLISKKASVGPWPGAESVDLAAFQPKGCSYLYVLGGCADVSREAAAGLLRSSDFMRIGNRIGQAAANEAARRKRFGQVSVAGRSVSGDVVQGEIRERLLGVRDVSSGAETVSSPQRMLPVLGRYDVVVVGGGTAGAPAGIGAARQGAKTLVVEYLSELGGVGTVGLINSYWCGNRVGFTREIDRGVGNQGEGNKEHWNRKVKAEWYRQELRKVGGELWTGCIGNGVLVDGNRVSGVVVVTPYGRGVVLCNTVVDTTGNADLAAAAGAETQFGGDEILALQGTGLSAFSPTRKSGNSDWSYVKESDLLDRTRMRMVGMMVKFPEYYDISSLLLSRERRFVVADYELTPLDIELRRTFGDTIAQTRSNLDSHGYTIHPLYRFYFPSRGKQLSASIPYRCLLPRGLDGILVAAIGAGYHRDVLPIVRMQADVQNTGYAAGVAAAMVAAQKTTARGLDIRTLQRHLVEMGNLPMDVLDTEDTPALGSADIRAALGRLSSGEDFATVLAAPAAEALPLVADAYLNETGRNRKVLCARLLAELGSPDGNETLLEEVRSRDWDEGWSFQGFGNHGSGVSEMDSMILSFGETGCRQAVPVILEKLSAWTPESAFSHLRACTLALAKLGDEQAVSQLTRLLQLPGMSGHALRSLPEAVEKTPPGHRDTTTREQSLRELLLAEALFRCGDSDGIGRNILTQYAEDLRGLYSVYARSVLSSKLKN